MIFPRMRMARRFDDSITNQVIACIIRVHQVLGPGFLESIYWNALVIELQKRKLHVEVEKLVVVYYEEHLIGRHRIDVIVESTVIVELKNVESLSKAHYAQVRSYLKATGLPIAILVNFAGASADFRRVSLERLIPRIPHNPPNPP